jgi:alpha-L-rhamnosidase
MDYLQALNPDLVRKRSGTQLGDWLNVNTPTAPDLIATAFWALDADMMAQMSRATGQDSDAHRYDELLAKLRTSFLKAYIKEDGVIGNGSQTSYVLALQANLVPDTLKPAAVMNLVKDIEAHDWHLTTGFLATPYLLSVLADNGRTDVAYRLLLNDTYPSWGYMIRKGATTWWERWNSDTAGVGIFVQSLLLRFGDGLALP